MSAVSPGEELSNSYAIIPFKAGEKAE